MCVGPQIQDRVLDPLELELQVDFKLSNMGAGDQTPSL